MELSGKLLHHDELAVWMEGQEVVRKYFATEKITFGISHLLPGAVGDLDPGHAEADEVFFCVKGNVLCYFPEENHYYEMKEGDALLIPPARGHKLFNIGQTEAIITWSCAPHP
ncbi:MAG: cupin domain-containing protein [Anaerolineaceae bacterium]|nr:cupin domain-containing protein [Anaerolineaceae bacterium]